mgnify:CR=1 FL=1
MNVYPIEPTGPFCSECHAKDRSQHIYVVQVGGTTTFCLCGPCRRKLGAFLLGPGTHEVPRIGSDQVSEGRKKAKDVTELNPYLHAEGVWTGRRRAMTTDPVGEGE